MDTVRGGHAISRDNGGRAVRAALSWFDLERLGWEEGDVIAGLTIVGDEKVPTGRMRVSCDAEPSDDGELSQQEPKPAERELAPAVSTPERELVPAVGSTQA